MPADAFNIGAYLDEFGLRDPRRRQEGRALLERHALTRVGKRNMAREKLPQAEAVLKQHYVRSCGSANCQAHLAGDPRQAVPVEREQCDVCGGSHAALALDTMVQALRKSRHTRLLVVGGTPNQWADLKERLPADIACERVDGTARVNESIARTQLRRSDLVIIWGPTPLLHKVSQNYILAAEKEGRKEKTVAVQRRGLASLAEDVRSHVERLAGGG